MSNNFEGIFADSVLEAVWDALAMSSHREDLEPRAAEVKVLLLKNAILEKRQFCAFVASLGPS